MTGWSIMIVKITEIEYFQVWYDTQPQKTDHNTQLGNTYAHQNLDLRVVWSKSNPITPPRWNTHDFRGVTVDSTLRLSAFVKHARSMYGPSQARLAKLAEFL